MKAKKTRKGLKKGKKLQAIRPLSQFQPPAEIPGKGYTPPPNLPPR
jgi:hypothetical protein